MSLGSGIQDSIHLLMNCIFVNSEKRNDIAQILLNNQFHQIDSVSDQKVSFYHGAGFQVS